MTARRMHARALAVLNRIKRQSTIERTQDVYAAYAEEWRPVAGRGTTAVLPQMLLVDAIGFVCASCAVAFFGTPHLLVTSSHAGHVRSLCRTCTENPPEPRAWPFGRKRK